MALEELAKEPDFHAIEAKWQSIWESEGTYVFNPESGKPIFSQDTPPPS